MHSPKTFLEIVGEPSHPSPLDRSALVLIDIQREYVDGAVPLENVQAAAIEAGRLLGLARKHGVPVFHIAHGSGPGAPVFAPMALMSNTSTLLSRAPARNRSGRPTRMPSWGPDLWKRYGRQGATS